MTRAVVLLGAMLVGGCDLDRVIGLSTDPDAVRTVERPLRFSPQDRIDVLLVIDDSGSMAPKQARMRAELPGFLSALAKATAQRDLRVGVITTDLGAPGISCGKNRGAMLNAIGAGAPVPCQPPVGASWLSLSESFANVPEGQSIEQTIACMTNVGDKGCGFEMPLEAARRQIEMPESERLMRDDALLVVLFVTDEDDCSAPPTSDLFAANPAYGPLNSFRCARYGVVCGEGLLTGDPGAREGCRPAEAADGGKLVSAEDYTRLFGRPRSEGGVKDDPLDVIVAAIAPPAAPLAVEIARDPAICGADATSCSVVSHSCTSPSDASFFGDPAVRLDAVLHATGGLSRSICDASYQPFFDALRARVEAAATGNACVPGAVAEPAHAECRVTVAGVDVRRCDVAVDQTLCWYLEPDERCPAQIDPRSGDGQSLHMRIVGAETDEVAATCSVLSAQ